MAPSSSVILVLFLLHGYRGIASLSCSSTYSKSILTTAYCDCNGCNFPLSTVIMILQMTNSSEQCYRSILQQLQLTLPAKTESLQIIQYYEEQLLYVLIKSAETFEAVSSMQSVSSFEWLIHWTVRVLNSDQLSFIMLLVMYF